MKSIPMVWNVACQWWAKWKTMKVKEAVATEKVEAIEKNPELQKGIRKQGMTEKRTEKTSPMKSRLC